ncbi:MAG: GHKL domain-containing protein [Deltaproteobacteria bacterium]|nr:GHKL domain-containing protein [Deltaproteobacteria bacterium]
MKKINSVQLPLFIFVAVALGTVFLWNFAVEQEKSHIERVIQLKSDGVNEVISDQLEARAQSLIRMAKRWEIQGRPAQKAWESDASLYVSHYSGYQAIEWVDPTLHARWVVPFKGNESEVNKDLGADEGRASALKASMDRNEILFSRPSKLENGENVIFLSVPIFRNNFFEGYIVGNFRIKEVLDSFLKRESTEGYSIKLFSANDEVYVNKADSFGDAWAQDSEIELYGASLRLRVEPSYNTLHEMQSGLSNLILAAGLTVSVLVALMVYFAQNARIRAKAAEAANTELEREVKDRKRAEAEAERNSAEVTVKNRELEQEISERKRAEEAVEKHASELERSNRELEQFAYVASHDLQEPLRVISGYVQLLAKRYKGKLDPSADEFISFAVDGANRMQVLISDLLAYSRVGSQIKEFRETDCQEVLSSTISNLKPLIDETNAKITATALPKVMADSSQMCQLFQNLIGNAIKYKHEAKYPQVHISSVKKGSEWLFSVKDNGIGIDPKYFDRIFVIFQRLHGKHEYSGTGIGLSICKKIVEKHGGRIWVESQPGEGSTFCFTIPI